MIDIVCVKQEVKHIISKGSDTPTSDMITTEVVSFTSPSDTIMQHFANVGIIWSTVRHCPYSGRYSVYTGESVKHFFTKQSFGSHSIKGRIDLLTQQ